MTDSTRWIQTLTSLLAIALKDLQHRHPLGWHWLPRTGLNLLIFALPIVIGWVLIVLPVQQAIGTLQQEEVQLKQAYLGKLQQSIFPKRFLNYDVSWSLLLPYTVPKQHQKR